MNYQKNNLIDFYNIDSPLGIPGMSANQFYNFLSNDNPAEENNNITYKFPKEFREFDTPDWGYKFNNFVYRCDDFNIVENREFLFAGCSFTLGEGTPLEYTWPFRFLRLYEEKNKIPSNRLKLSNLGYSGASVEGSYLHVMSVLNSYKHLNVLCFFAPYHRLLFPKIKDDKITLFDTHPEFKNADLDKKVKDELMMFYSSNSDLQLKRKMLNDIFSLKLFVENKGSNFYWSTWDFDINKEFSDLKKTKKNNPLLKSFVPNLSDKSWFDFKYRARDGIHPPKEYYEIVAQSFVKHF